MTRPWAGSLAIVLLALLAAVALAGCGSAPEGGVVPPQDDQGRYVISMTSDLRFEPARAQVPAGATVVWRNDSEGIVHDVAGYRGDPIEEDREEFSSYRQPPEGLGRPIAPGETFNHTFAGDGAWTLWCHTHHEQDMKGVVLVG